MGQKPIDGWSMYMDPRRLCGTVGGPGESALQGAGFCRLFVSFFVEWGVQRACWTVY